MIDSIIFDMDGTLWDSTPEVASAFNKVLRDKYPEVSYEVTPERLRELFGLPLDVIAVRLFTGISEEYAKNIMKDCCEYECEYLAENGATLYEGLERVLKTLSLKYKLAIVSNCQEGYIQCFFEANPGLEKYFTDYEYPGRSGKYKADNIRMVVERNNMRYPLYVGDTRGDADAAKEAGVPFVYARYGFGNVKEYYDVIDSLPELVKKLLNNNALEQ
jgi:phosphoglycolate phosphatase